MMGTKLVFIKKARGECYHKLRKYLQVDYKIPYKGGKGHTIGRLLFSCLHLL